MRSILVSHPHAAAFATATAEALERDGRLALFFTGVAGAAKTLRGGVIEAVARRRPEALNRVISGIPGERIAPLWAVELAARAAAQIAPRAVRRAWRQYDALFVLHDLAVSVLPWPEGTQVVYAYEDGALRTFRRAARRGLARIWDLPLPHWATLDGVWRDEAVRWPGAMGASPHLEPYWKRRRKDAELALADVVSVASNFTRLSLEVIGCDKRILVTPYGFPVDQFDPRTKPVDGPFTVLAVGTHDLRKGTPYLLEAWRRAAIKGGKLRIVGPMRLTRTFLARYDGLFEHVPHVPRRNLAREYQAAELLAFPTLGDGFGLVIQEAMCCGTPVLTTRCGGGPECIDDGVEGWLAPERDVDALVARLREAAQSRDRLAEMGRAARRRAERWTWHEAGDMLATALSRL